MHIFILYINNTSVFTNDRFKYTFFINSNLSPIKTYIAGDFKIIEFGKLINISFCNANFSVNAGAFTAILELDKVPQYEYGAAFVWASGGTDPKAGMLKVTTDKKLLMWAETSAVTYAYGSITYMLE